jgi:hypothetical protein
MTNRKQLVLTAITPDFLNITGYGGYNTRWALHVAPHVCLGIPLACTRLNLGSVSGLSTYQDCTAAPESYHNMVGR